MARNMTTLTLAIESKQAKQVLNNLKRQMESVTKTLEETQEKFRGEREWDLGDTADKISRQIKDLKKDLKSLQSAYDQGVTQIDGIDKKLKNLSKATYNELTKERTTLTNSLKNRTLSTKKEIKAYEEAAERLQKVRDEIAKRDIDIRGTMTERKAADVMGSPIDYSTSEIQEAIKVTEKLASMQKIGSAEWKTYTDQVKAANEILAKFKDEAKIDAMAGQLSNIGSLSKSALAEQKKFWQGISDGASIASQEWTEAEKHLKDIRMLEESRTSAEATGVISNVLSGSWDKTIKETEDAIKLIQEYKKQLHTQTDAPLIEQANQAIEALNANLGKAKEGLMDIAEAKQIADDLKHGQFDGTAEDIDKARKSLEAYRKTLRMSTEADEIKKVDEALAELAASADAGGKNLKSLGWILDNLKSASMEDLQSAAQRLQEQLKNATRNTEDYVRTSKRLQQVNKELERVKKEWEGQESLFIRMTKRLSVYMAAYGSLSAITSYLKDIGQANLQLSDAIADVAKTTGLEAEKLSQLGEDIRSIDTRTAQEQLYELAAAAGQLGIKSENEIAGFVRAANMITVSLNELGTEATTQLMKIATLTGEAQNGTEQALLSIGSAINELTANSAAAAGPIVDLMNRMGGVAAQSGITSAQMAAIGATADALGQSVEITGTSMNKFLTTLTSSSDQIAYALNMDAKALRSFINEGNTMGAVIAVFERMSEMGGLGKLAPIMGELGSEGARMTQVLAALSGRVDLLKAQLEISNSAYEEAVSIQNEYNIKNENAIAIIQRMGNALKETFTNNIIVDGITAILRAVYNFGVFLKECSTAAKLTASAIAALTAALLANRIAWVKNMQAMSWSRQLVIMRGLFRSLTDSIKAGAATMLQWGKNIVSAVTSVGGFKKALQGLKALLAANWITLAVGGITALATWIYKTATYVSEATKATARYNRELKEETNKVDLLFNSLKRLNSKETDRANIINQINQQYGTYLGFMLDEKDSAEKLAAAHQLINAELRKRMALNLQNTLEGSASTTYADTYEKETENITKAVKGEGLFKGAGWVNKVSSGEVNTLIDKIINKAVEDAITKDAEGKFRELGTINTDDILNSIKKEMTARFDIKGQEGEIENIGIPLFNNLKSNIKELLDARVQYIEDVLNAERVAELEMARITEDEFQSRKEMVVSIEKEFSMFNKDTQRIEKVYNAAVAEAAKYQRSDSSEKAKGARSDKEKAEKDLRDHYTRMIDNANDYVEAVKTLMKVHGEELSKADKDTFNERIAFYEKQSKELATKIPGLDPWGKGRDVKDWKEFTDIITNIDTSSAAALAAAYKKITEDTSKIPDNVEQFYEMFRLDGVEPIGLEKLGLTNATDVANLIHLWAEEIKNKLKTKYGRNTSLGFIFEDDSNKKKKTAQQMYKEWLAELEAYYNERETLIRQRGQEQNKLESEINRELEALNAEKLRAQRELEEGLLKDQASKSTFDPKSYVGPITNTKYFADMTLEQMRAIVSAGGSKLDAEIRKNLTDRMVKLEEQAYKIKQRIEKILLQDDFTAQVKEEYLKALDELGLLFNIEAESQTEMSREQGEARLAYMREWAKESYNLTAEQLEANIRQNELFNAWVEGRDAEHYEALLVQLRKFHDDQIEADKKAADRRKKILESSDTGRALTQQNEANIREEEKDVEMWDRFKGMGLASDDAVDKAQIDMYQAKIDASNAWIHQIDAQIAAEKAQLEWEMQKMQLQISLMKMRGEDTSELEAQFLAMQQHYNSLSNQQALMTLQHKQDIADAEKEIENRRISMQQNMVGEVQKYTEALTQVAYDAAYAEEDADATIAEARNAMIKSLLTSLKDWAQMKLTELTLNAMFGSQRLAQEGQETSASLGMKSAEASGEVTAATIKATAREVGSKGLVGLAVGAVIGAALNALLGAAMAKLDKKQAEIKNKSGVGRLATGMLTYAEGNYPVLGNDGKVYDAKYEGSGMKTGIYRGGAHFGIFSEKKPEAIIDGDTTQRLILNHPDIWKAIVTLSKNGRLDSGMGVRTFARGNVHDFGGQVAEVSGGVAVPSAEMQQMQAALDNNSRVMAQLSQLLAGGIHAKVDMYGSGGVYESMQKADRFMGRRRG